MMVVHLTLHCEDVKRGGRPSPAELLSRIVERAADLSPELQKILWDFASELNEVSTGEGQSHY